MNEERPKIKCHFFAWVTLHSVFFSYVFCYYYFERREKESFANNHRQKKKKKNENEIKHIPSRQICMSCFPDAQI